jgi:hypothetical protein
LVGFGVLQQQINLIRRFFSNPQTPDSGITHEMEVVFENHCISADAA